MAHIGQEFRFGLIGILGAGFLRRIFFGEVLELLLGLAQILDGREQARLAVLQFAFLLLQAGDVGADRNITAVLGAPLAEQPVAVVKLCLE